MARNKFVYLFTLETRLPVNMPYMSERFKLMSDKSSLASVRSRTLYTVILVTSTIIV